MIRKIEVLIRILVWSFNQTFKPTTYDDVVYNGKHYYIKSSFTGYNIWNLYESESREQIHSYIKGSDLKIIHSLRRFRVVFKGNLNFQLNNWYMIDCSKPIGSRLSYNNSDNIKFS